MNDKIKYEELSQQVKAEIKKYHEEEAKKGIDLKPEEAMLKWFEDSFDEWVLNNFGEGHSDKRKFYRIYIEIPINITDTLIESTKEEASAMNFGTVENISRGGFFFKSKQYIEASSIIKVKIDLQQIDKELKDIEALAMVLRCDQLDKDDYGIGLMFSSIYDENRENLDSFIFRNVVDHLNIFED